MNYKGTWEGGGGGKRGMREEGMDGDDDFWTHPINNTLEKEAFPVVIVVEAEEAELNSNKSLIPNRKESCISQGRNNSGREIFGKSLPLSLSPSFPFLVFPPSRLRHVGVYRFNFSNSSCGPCV